MEFFFLSCRGDAVAAQCADAAYMYGHAYGNEQQKGLYKGFAHEHEDGDGYYDPEGRDGYDFGA